MRLSLFFLGVKENVLAKVAYCPSAHWEYKTQEAPEQRCTVWEMYSQLQQDFEKEQKSGT